MVTTKMKMLKSVDATKYIEILASLIILTVTLIHYEIARECTICIIVILCILTILCIIPAFKKEEEII